MSYDNTNKGAIWKNEDKVTTTQPDFKGSLDVDGVEYWVSAWKRDEGAKERSPALKFSITKKEARHEQGMSAARADVATTASEPDFDDHIPF